MAPASGDTNSFLTHAEDALLNWGGLSLMGPRLLQANDDAAHKRRSARDLRLRIFVTGPSTSALAAMSKKDLTTLLATDPAFEHNTRNFGPFADDNNAYVAKSRMFVCV